VDKASEMVRFNQIILKRTSQAFGKSVSDKEWAKDQLKKVISKGATPSKFSTPTQ